MSREWADSQPAALCALANARLGPTDDRENGQRRSAGAFFYSLVRQYDHGLRPSPTIAHRTGPRVWTWYDGRVLNSGSRLR